MNYVVTAIVLVSGITFMPVAAFAGERVNDAILGGVSGALVAGPVGLVAGGVIGYSAGPHIAHGMGLHNHKRHSYQRRAARNSDRSYR